MNWWQHLSLGNKLNIFVITTIIVLISIMAFLFQGLIRDIMIRQSYGAPKLVAILPL